jgi:hypothetical protein
VDLFYQMMPVALPLGTWEGIQKACVLAAKRVTMTQRRLLWKYPGVHSRLTSVQREEFR